MRGALDCAAPTALESFCLMRTQRSRAGLTSSALPAQREKTNSGQTEVCPHKEGYFHRVTPTKDLAKG